MGTNYQHPGRPGKHYSGNIDSFSAIVIYTAILALCQKPSLWDKYNNDENILFRQHDLIDPDNSNLFRDIYALTNPIQDFARRISTLCKSDFAAVPTLEEFLSTSRPTFPNSVMKYQTRSPYPQFSGTDTGSILEYIGQRVEVIGKLNDIRLGITRYGKSYGFLNMTHPYPNHTFTIVLWDEVADELMKGKKIAAIFR